MQSPPGQAEKGGDAVEIRIVAELIAYTAAIKEVEDAVAASTTICRCHSSRKQIRGAEPSCSCRFLSGFFRQAGEPDSRGEEDAVAVGSVAFRDPNLTAGCDLVRPRVVVVAKPQVQVRRLLTRHRPGQIAGLPTPRVIQALELSDLVVQKPASTSDIS